MTRLHDHWRDRVKDPNWFVRCATYGCRHAEQVHEHGTGACTAGPMNNPCQCGQFTPGGRTWIGLGPEPPEAA